MGENPLQPYKRRSETSQLLISRPVSLSSHIERIDRASTKPSRKQLADSPEVAVAQHWSKGSVLIT